MWIMRRFRHGRWDWKEERRMKSWVLWIAG
jgi:hypothetical protein